MGIENFSLSHDIMRKATDLFTYLFQYHKNFNGTDFCISILHFLGLNLPHLSVDVSTLP